MKSTKKENSCRVSDRAFRNIISDVIDSLTGCRIDPFTFKQVVTAVRSYLRPEGKMTGLGKKAKVIFDRLLPDIDRAVRRSTTARAVAARRKAAKNDLGTDAAETAQSANQSETVCTPAAAKQQKKIYSFPGIYSRAEIRPGGVHAPALRSPKGSRCPHTASLCTQAADNT